jgi:hypothetical protein
MGDHQGDGQRARFAGALRAGAFLATVLRAVVFATARFAGAFFAAVVLRAVVFATARFAGALRATAFLAGAFFATAFFAGAFFAAVAFRAVVLRAVVFATARFAGAFFAAVVLRAVVFAAARFAGAFLAAAFLAGAFFAAALFAGAVIAVPPCRQLFRRTIVISGRCHAPHRQYATPSCTIGSQNPMRADRVREHASGIAVPRRILCLVTLFSFGDGLQSVRGSIRVRERTEPIFAVGRLECFDAMVLQAEPERSVELVVRHVTAPFVARRMSTVDEHDQPTWL